MEYTEILEYLLNKLPMFQRVGKAAYKANLDNTIALSKHFGNPEKKFISVHVAGTNGKGSVSHMIASVLQEKGLKTGLCTSPHLKDFRERIKINGVMIPKRYICDFINENIEFIEKLSPSFFELTIIMTFKYFADEAVDIAVVETGLGGRLDSTNIVSPLFSIITNIGNDHADLLGDTPQKIAYEKAGIIKPETPVVIGQTQRSVSEVFINKAKENNSPVYFADQKYRVFKADDYNDLNNYYKYEVDSNNQNYIIETAMGGACQNCNLATVLQCVDLLNSADTSFNISETQLIRGLKNVVKNTGLQGRWQIINKNPLTVCDTGHNIEAFKMICDHLKKLKYTKLHIVIGFVNDKDIKDILQILPQDAKYYFTNSQQPRAIKAFDLRKMSSAFKLYGDSYNSVKEAYRTATKNASKDDLIYIGGSTFVVAEVL